MTNLIYVLDYRFFQTPDGAVWTDTAYSSPFWDVYLQTFSHITLLSRARQVTTPDPQWKRVDSSQISVISLPHYLGPAQYLSKAIQIRRIIKATLNRKGVFILRIPSNLSSIVATHLEKANRPYAVEVVGDPHEALAPGVVQMKGRPFFRWHFAHRQRHLCATASSAAYVAEVLRRRYPSKSSHVLVCSDVRLEDDWLALQERNYDLTVPRRILTVATLSQTYKGIDVLLDAISICKRRGISTSLTIAGEGKYRGQLEAHAKALGIADQVNFTGAIAWGQELKQAFDNADIFVLPSRVEVLPRALLEAMARALPAIATNVGAVHEVLAPQDLVDPGNAIQLADRITTLLADPAILTLMSQRNLLRARSFAAESLLPRWHAFHRTIAGREPSIEQAPALTQFLWDNSPTE